MGTIKAKCSMMLRTTGGMLAAGLLAGFCLTIGHVSAAFAGKRKFYLTTGSPGFLGNQVLTACASGYHTAALWEILDPSNLEYDTKRGVTTDDAGSGPPAGSDGDGWIRTGNFSDTAGGPGRVNCAAWTSASGAHLGTIVRLQDTWATTMYPINPWVPGTKACSSPEGVWCVSDNK
jgi:hypothetical protein